MHYKFKILIFLFQLSFALFNLRAQTIQIFNTGTRISIRGLSVVDERVIWVSGSNGTIGKSVDSGNTFKFSSVKGFEKTDFRDIEAFDENTAVIMGISEPAYLLRTKDGGDTWTVVYENKTKGMFLDAMEFRNNGRTGMAVGDPVDGRFVTVSTNDGGVTWKDSRLQDRALADSGEGCFASSGTNIRSLDQGKYVFVTGGLHSNLVMATSKILLPLIQGKETTGANSVAVKNSTTLIVVGGDFNTKDSTVKNCFITTDAGNTWITPITPPHGYRSCVEWLGQKNWISCGLNGIDYSDNDGRDWHWISKESFHVCRKSKQGKAVFFAGGNGRIGKLIADHTQ